MAFQGIKTGFADRPSLGCLLGVRYHNSLCAAIEDTGRVIWVMQGGPAIDVISMPSAATHTRAAVSSLVGLCSRWVVFEVDIDRIETTGCRHHRDVWCAQLVDPQCIAPVISSFAFNICLARLSPICIGTRSPEDFFSMRASCSSPAPRNA